MIEKTNIETLHSGDVLYHIGDPPCNEHGDIYESNVSEIWLTNDGNGGQGNYDRIHVIFSDGASITFVAEKCTSWHIKAKDI